MRTTTLLAALLLVGTAVAAAPDSPPPLDLDKAAAAAQIADPAAAAAAYLDAVPTERRAKTKAYALGNYVLDVVEAGWDVLVYAALLAFGVSARLRDRAERLTASPALQVATYFVPFLVSLPLYLGATRIPEAEAGRL